MIHGTTTIAEDQRYVLLPEDLPKYEHLITETEEPVDNLFSEKQQRLLVETLYNSWKPDAERYEGKFITMANVGLFYGEKQPPLVPDVMLSLGVEAPKGNHMDKENRSYFIWGYSKPPEIVIEIVSNLEGGELGHKMDIYASSARVPYYVVFDPFECYGKPTLRIFKGNGLEYEPIPETFFPGIGLGLKLWTGEYETMFSTWLRWHDAEGQLIPTGKERAEKERERAEKEHERAEKERERAEKERERAEKERERAEKEHERVERLAEQLRQLGITPDEKV